MFYFGVGCRSLKYAIVIVLLRGGVL